MNEPSVVALNKDTDEILAVGEEMGCSMDEIIKGLLAAGLVGAFIANQASFGAEVAACQAENGSASAMAAAIFTPSRFI